MVETNEGGSSRSELGASAAAVAAFELRSARVVNDAPYTTLAALAVVSAFGTLGAFIATAVNAGDMARVPASACPPGSVRLGGGPGPCWVYPADASFVDEAVSPKPEAQAAAERASAGVALSVLTGFGIATAILLYAASLAYVSTYKERVRIAAAEAALAAGGAVAADQTSAVVVPSSAETADGDAMA